MSLPITLLGPVDYAPTAAAMQAFTEQRGPDTADALWICEHPPVYTQGLAGKADHILNPGSIPIVQTNRCLLYTSPSPRDRTRSRMPSSA